MIFISMILDVNFKNLLGNEETQLAKLLKPIWTHDPDQNPP